MSIFSDYINITSYFADLRRDLNITSLPKLSIITVVKDDRSGLIETIKSVKSQNYLQLEHIVINAGKKIDQIENVLILNEADLGIADAFNKGLSGAIGELTLILNAGDVLLPNVLNEVIEFMDSQAEIGVFCFSAVFADFNQKPFIRKSKDCDLNKYMSVVHPATFVRRVVYIDIGLFDLNFKIAMDYDFLLRAKSKGIKFISSDKQIVEFNLSGLSEKKWINGFIETISAKRLNKIKINFIFEIYSFYYHFAYIMLRSLKLYSVIYFFRKTFSRLSSYAK